MRLPVAVHLRVQADQARQQGCTRAGVPKNKELVQREEDFRLSHFFLSNGREFPARRVGVSCRRGSVCQDSTGKLQSIHKIQNGSLVPGQIEKISASPLPGFSVRVGAFLLDEGLLSLEVPAGIRQVSVDLLA